MDRIKPLDQSSALLKATRAGAQVIAIQNQAGIDTGDSFVSGEQFMKVVALAEKEHERQIQKVNELIDMLNDLSERVVRLERSGEDG